MTNTSDFIDDFDEQLEKRNLERLNHLKANYKPDEWRPMPRDGWPKLLEMLTERLSTFNELNRNPDLYPEQLKFSIDHRYFHGVKAITVFLPSNIEIRFDLGAFEFIEKPSNETHARTYRLPKVKDVVSVGWRYQLPSRGVD